MCLILLRKKGTDVPKEVIKTSARINPHGLGIVWLDTYKITYHKSNEYKVLFTDRPYIAHFRYATVGEIGKSNTHPFVCGKQKHEYLMMNGHICNLGNTKDCDSKLLARAIGEVPRQRWKDELSKYACRFVTVNVRNRTYQIYNKDLWTQRGGVWYSKDNVLEDNLVAVYGTLKKGNGNYHHYLSDSKFVGHGTTTDKYPLVVEGLPYMIDHRGKGHNVKVDVFKVSNMVLRNLDMLEGHPNWYERKVVDITVKGKVLKCWLYFSKRFYHDDLVMHESYEYKPYVPANNYKLDFPADWQTKSPKTYSWDWDLDTYDKSDESNGPVCSVCFHDLDNDAYGHYYCEMCEEWYTENQVIKCDIQ
jgi:gamma-glutamylcyclotransferase (GGCT)/AIG2-like uncharacterized protein YtfP